MTDKNGLLPIHVAVLHSCSKETLEELIGAYPDSLHARTPEGESILSIARRSYKKNKALPIYGNARLPLHTICSYTNVKINKETKDQLILEMMNVYPEALVQSGGKKGHTPLHNIVLGSRGPISLVQAMIQKDPTAILILDNDGFLPIHLAVQRHCSIELLQTLLRASPQSLHAEIHDGESVLDIAARVAKPGRPNAIVIEHLKALLGPKENMNPESAEVDSKKPAAERRSSAGRDDMPGQDQACCVCLTIPDPEKATEVDSCGHTFCYDCIKLWADRREKKGRMPNRSNVYILD